MTIDSSDTTRTGPSPEPDFRQVNQYDKVFRENAEAFLPGLIRKVLHIEAESTIELPDDIQHTRERKPDVLKKITDKNGQTFVLHIELQTTDEKEMALRMAEYYIMLRRCYQLPVRQYVIYLGKGSPQMADHICSEKMNYEYELIHLSSIDYQVFLKADKPEERILALLANFGNQDAQQVVETIIKEVCAASEGEFSTRRHLKQLQILAKLRNFNPKIIKIMESITLMDKIVNRILEEEIRRKFVWSLLKNTRFSVRKIASLVDVSESFVLDAKKSLRA